MLTRKVWLLNTWKVDEFITIADVRLNPFFCEVSFEADLIMATDHHLSSLFKLVNTDKSENEAKV